MNIYRFAGSLITGILLFFVFSCNNSRDLTYFKLSGFAQGTSYNITYGVPDSLDYSESIDSLLRDFDNSMSTYLEGSLISRINRNEEDLLDDRFLKVLEVAGEVYKDSDGAFDLTVMPLVNAWGFGPGRRLEMEQKTIDSLLRFVGMDKIRVEEGRLVKDRPEISLDVNAIAQGLSVDEVAAFLKSKNISNYMVEIGGEVKTLGLNPKQQIWKIGVDRPEYGNYLPGQNLQVILELKDKSLATSGNYRKFYEQNGVKYSHSIDPSTGYPVMHQLLSVTIISDECVVADAYATACMVSGLEKAREIVDSVDGLEAYFIFNDENGEYQTDYSEGFSKYIYKETGSEN